MMMHPLLLVVVAGYASSMALPDAPVVELGGFQPVQGARGTGPSSGYSAPPPFQQPPILPTHGTLAPAPAPALGPTKTIYVNVPHSGPPPEPLPPITAGPPRKHYKIVFIRAPPPPPPPQPILPPRTEQKTLIYVLHQRPQVQEQKVIKVPNVQHEPEVYFVQYDKPPSAEELQQLTAGNLQGYSLAAQRTGASGAVNRSPALSIPRSDEISLELLGGLGDDYPASGFGGGGSVEVPLTGFGGGGGGGGVPLPVLGGGVTTPSTAGVGLPLPTLQGAIGSGTRAPLPGGGGGGGGGSVGIPLPGLGGSLGTGSSASVFPASVRGGGGGGGGPPGGSGLRIIGDDLVRPIGNTGFFQEVDDDYFGNSFESAGVSLESNFSFENRLGAAAAAAAAAVSPHPPART